MKLPHLNDGKIHRDLSKEREEFASWDVDKKIDFLLPYFVNGNFESNLYEELQHQDTDYAHIVRDTKLLLFEEELIKLVNYGQHVGHSTVATAFGRRIHRDGGWLKHIRGMREKIEREEQLLQSSITNNESQMQLSKSVKTTNRVQILSAIISTIILIFMAWVSWAQYQRDQAKYKEKSETEIRMDELEKRLNTIKGDLIKPAPMPALLPSSQPQKALPVNGIPKKLK